MAVSTPSPTDLGPSHIIGDLVAKVSRLEIEVERLHAIELALGGGAHDVLSATHGDADPQAVTRGSIIYGNATPKWGELVIGAKTEVLTVNAGSTEPEWAAAIGAPGPALIRSLTNKSGAQVDLGDTVIVDVANANSFTTTAVEGQFRYFVGVAQATIADNAAGIVLLYGVTEQINLDGAAALGDFIRTDGVAKQGTPVDEWIAGVFGQVLEAGAAPAAIINSMPQVGAWNPIAETVLGAPAASVTFAAIPGTYRAVVIHALLRTSRANQFDNAAWRVNADAGNNYDYSRNQIYFNQVQTEDARTVSEAKVGFVYGANGRASCFAPFDIMWIGYADATREKDATSLLHTGFDFNDDTDLRMTLSMGHRRNTDAIILITILPVIGPNWVAGCKFALYGIV